MKPRDEMATPLRTACTQVKGMFQPGFMSPSICYGAQHRQQATDAQGQNKCATTRLTPGFVSVKV